MTPIPTMSMFVNELDCLRAREEWYKMAIEENKQNTEKILTAFANEVTVNRRLQGENTEDRVITEECMSTTYGLICDILLGRYGKPLMAALETCKEIEKHWSQKMVAIKQKQLMDNHALPDWGSSYLSVPMLLETAQAIVERKIVWKKFIEGTPLSNDIAVWMVDFVHKCLEPILANNTEVRGVPKDITPLDEQQVHELLALTYSPERASQAIGRVLRQDVLKLASDALTQAKDKFTPDHSIHGVLDKALKAIENHTSVKPVNNF